MAQAENELKSNSFKQWTQTIDVWHALLFLADPKAIVTDDAYNSYNTILGNPIKVVCFVALGLWAFLGPLAPVEQFWGFTLCEKTVFLESLVFHK